MKSARALLAVVLCLSFAALHAATPALNFVRAAVPDSTRILPIADDALTGPRYTLFTHRRTQYAAFLAADARLVLARRVL
ncbi:MAG: hypothetical protein RIQ79_2031, partial [Verrucomicrobiota bacterium]